MMASYRWTQSVLAAATAFALLVSFSTAQAVEAEQAPAEAKPAQAAVGEQAPDFELKDLEGNVRKLSEFRGQIVVLHFQSPTCPWEQAYQSYLSEVATKYASTRQGEEEVKVQFLGINANRGETVESIAAYATERRIPYPILKDEGNVVADLYSARTTPHMYIIDQEGVLQYMGGVEKVPTAVSQATKMEEQYFEPVLQAVITGSELPHTETISKGCAIKRVRTE